MGGHLIKGMEDFYSNFGVSGTASVLRPVGLEEWSKDPAHEIPQQAWLVEEGMLVWLSEVGVL